MNAPISLLGGFVCVEAFIVATLLSSQAAAAGPDPDVANFIAAKRKQVEQTAGRIGAPVPPEVWKMFDAAASANWRSTSNLFYIVGAKYKPLEQQTETNRLAPEVWYPVQEVGGFCEMFTFS